jgi:hypothetical protein
MMLAQAHTPQLAAVAGAYLLLSAAGLLARGRAEAVVADLRAHPAVAHVLGAVAFLVGAALIALHPRFGSPLEALVTLTGIWWALEGAALLVAPARLLSRPDAAIHLRRMNLLALPVGVLLLGGALLVFTKVTP